MRTLHRANLRPWSHSRSGRWAGLVHREYERHTSTGILPGQSVWHVREPTSVRKPMGVLPQLHQGLHEWLRRLGVRTSKGVLFRQAMLQRSNLGGWLLQRWPALVKRDQLYSLPMKGIFKERFREVFLVVCVVALASLVLWKNWPRSPKPYFAQAQNVIEALRTGDYDKFEKALARNTLSVHRLDRATLRAVFSHYLSPLYSQGTIRPYRLSENREFGNGSAIYWMKLPNAKEEVRIGCTAFFDGKSSQVFLEHLIIDSFAIQAAPDGILHVAGGLQIRRYAPKLAALGMHGVATTREDGPSRYFTWEEYAAAFDAIAKADKERDTK